jgi:hypothetical protein
MDKPAPETPVTTLALVPAKLPSKIKQKKFAPCLKVILTDFTTVEVPIDKTSSDAQRSIMVAKTRDFVDKQLDKLKDKTLTPLEISQLVKAVADIDGLQREQFVASLNNSGPSTPMGAGLQEMIRGAAQGAAAGTAQGFLDKMKAFDKAAKKVEAATDKVIDV